MLIVLNAPSVNDEYYAEVFEGILDFHVDFAKKVIGNDEVIVLADADTMPLLEDRLPAENLLEAEIADIWMRDFTTVNPLLPIEFVYLPSYLEEEHAEAVQGSFFDFAEEHNLNFVRTDLILDGGNVVDNYVDKIIVTERFLEDNEIEYEEAKIAMEEVAGVQMAIIPYDDEIMGHADGMLMWLDDNTIAVNKYEEPFRSTVLDELNISFRDVRIVEVEADFKIDEWKDFASACGINVNALTTFKNIYVPVFGSELDDKFIELISKHTDKKIIPINAENVCFMGGSVRCLSWQITGSNANKLLEAAKN